MKETVLVSHMHSAIENIDAKLKFILANSEIEFENPITPIRQPKMRQLISLQTSEAMLDAIIEKMGLEFKPVVDEVNAASGDEPVVSEDTTLETPETGEDQSAEPTSNDESETQETEPADTDPEPVVSEDTQSE